MDGGVGVEASPQVLIILSPPKAINFLVYSKFGFVRSLDLFELWVCSKFGFVRSLGLFDSTDPLVIIIQNILLFLFSTH